ncbi:hypothetical protein [Nocardioides convexus]|uniref:hypothetical protein n=1 Tax=Nocardioides convexus TaxID=2712224 RepID=UPI00241831FC|nr:hypothetical protein [Nocardioides convexus]
MPKNVAISLPYLTARVTQRPMRAFTAVASGPIRVLNGSANAIVRRLGIEPQEEPALRAQRHRVGLADPALRGRGHPRRRHRRA